MTVELPLLRTYPPRRLTTGRLNKLMTSFAQPTKWKRNRWLGVGVGECGDIELSGYLVNTTGPVSLVLHLHITHKLFGSSSDPSINGHLHYPNDFVALTLSPLCLLLIVRLGVYLHYLRVVFSSHLKSKVDNILDKTTALRIVLNIDVTHIDSKSHTHPSHSQTSQIWKQCQIWISNW
jgi:hypothetical protein